jgi:hypothetical protein
MWWHSSLSPRGPKSYKIIANGHEQTYHISGIVDASKAQPDLRISWVPFPWYVEDSVIPRNPHVVPDRLVLSDVVVAGRDGHSDGLSCLKPATAEFKYLRPQVALTTYLCPCIGASTVLDIKTISSVSRTYANSKAIQTTALFWLTEQTSRNWVYHEKLVKKFRTFCGTPKYVIVFTRACHWTLFWRNYIQSIFWNPTSVRSILILSPPTTQFTIILPLQVFLLHFLNAYFKSLISTVLVSF